MIVYSKANPYAATDPIRGDGTLIFSFKGKHAHIYADECVFNANSCVADVLFELGTREIEPMVRLCIYAYEKDMRARDQAARDQAD